MELIAVRKYLIDSFSVHRNKILLLLKILIAAALLTYIISTIKISQIADAFEDANYFLVALAFVLLIPNILLQYWKWKITCKSILNYSDNKTILYSLLQGLTAGAFTPFRIGEYFGRAFLFKDRTIIQVTVATLIDKFFPLVLVAFIGAAASILFIYFFYSISAYLAASLFMVVTLIFYLLIQLIIDPEFWNNFLFNKLKKSKLLHKYLGKMRFLKTLERNYSLKMFLISFLFYTCFVTQFVILIYAFSNRINIVDYYWSSALVMFGKTFFPAISLGELGIREGVSVFFLGEMGVAEAAAFNASLFLFFINILIPAIIGSFLLFKKNNA